MNTTSIENIAAAVLYEGYVLYPYRASSIKNRQRWNFGVLYPRAYAESQTGNDRWYSRTEILVQGSLGARLTIRARFLHLILGQQEDQPWQSAMEREVLLGPLRLPELCGLHVQHLFLFPPEGVQEPVQGMVVVTAGRLNDQLFRVRIEVINTSPAQYGWREEALFSSMVSTHSILGIEDGGFVSLLEPPDEFRGFAAECRNEGAWPVLVGEPGTRDAMLSSPIILYDYPRIAPESPGALFDGTEIDEILSLRIMTLTDEEKRQMRLDERTREILNRTDSMSPEQFMKLHGVLRTI